MKWPLLLHLHLLLLLQRLKEPLKAERDAGLARQAAAMKRLQAEKYLYVEDVSHGALHEGLVKI